MSTAIRVKLAIVIAVTLLLTTILLTHVDWLNGPAYWKWPPRHVPAMRWYPPMLLAAVPLFIAALASMNRPIISIALLMISMLAMQVVAAAMPEDPPGLDRIVYIVESPTNLSYFSDADRSMHISTRELLADYPRFMPEFSMHSQEKPPGPILFFRLILGIFGASDRTALISGLIIGALATLAIPATYVLISELTAEETDGSSAPRSRQPRSREGARKFAKEERSGFFFAQLRAFFAPSRLSSDVAQRSRWIMDDRALLGATFVALCPGLILHLPQMDQLYPILTCALIACWYNAIKQESTRWAIAFGLVLAVACFVVYHFLVLGACLGAITIAHMISRRRKPVTKIVKFMMTAVATVIAAYAILFAVSGFNPIATFIQALHCQAAHLKDLYRPYPKTILHDLADFALGAGWIGCLLTMFLFARTQSLPRRHLVLAVICIGQIVLVAVTGLMETETARTWCFMLPLLAIPVGLELSRWPRRPRIMVIVMMWLILCLVGQNMKFIFNPTEQPAFSPPARSAL